MEKRILVVLAHPDDETFICGGTLATYAARGVQITYLCATKGEMGRRLGVPPIATRESLPALREAELRSACRALGIGDLRFLNLRDKTLDYYDPADLAARIQPVIDDLRPDVTLTFHELIGGHPDHCAIGRAATLAWRQAGGPGRLYHLLWKEHDEQLKTVGATQAQVTAIAIAGPAVEAKMAAYRAHRTQSELYEWLWSDETARTRLTRTEYFLQGSGAPRPGETDLFAPSR
jgi:bacillithiol biosynthesis deacetylase BshB2